MGAVYLDYTVKSRNGTPLTREDVEKHHLNRVRMDDMRYGHREGYSGHFNAKGWGIAQQPGTFTQEEARRHCEEHNDRSDPAFAYDLGDGSWYVGGWCRW